MTLRSIKIAIEKIKITIKLIIKFKILNNNQLCSQTLFL